MFYKIKMNNLLRVTSRVIVVLCLSFSLWISFALVLIYFFLFKFRVISFNLQIIFTKSVKITIRSTIFRFKMNYYFNISFLILLTFNFPLKQNSEWEWFKRSLIRKEKNKNLKTNGTIVHDPFSNSLLLFFYALTSLPIFS